MHEVLSDDIFIVYSCLASIVPHLREFDRGALQSMIIDSNLIHDLLERSSVEEEDPSLRMQCTTLLIDLYYDEATVLSNV